MDGCAYSGLSISGYLTIIFFSVHFDVHFPGVPEFPVG